MDDRTLKILLACVLGGTIGTLVALQFQFFGWIGYVIGVLVGYFSYEFKKALKAIPAAWNSIVGYRPTKQQVWNVIMPFSLLSNIVPTVLLLMLVPEDTMNWPLALFVGLMLVAIFGTIQKMPRISNVAATKKAAFFLSPVAVLVYWPFLILLATFREVIEYAPSAFKVLPAVVSFAKTVFILIHSEWRLLWMLDVVIGAGIGYFAGNVLIGVLVGGIIGVAHFELISKRILRLVPNR